MKIFLIGFMGSGKSTVGKKLAKKLKLHFIDLDKYIENKHSATINDIFLEIGEAEFRELERKALDEIVKRQDIIISTGGGTPCFHNNIEKMNQSGLTIYLETNPGILFSRLTNSKLERPLIQNKSETELKQYISETLKMRKEFYEQAKIQIDSKNLNISQLVLSIKSFLN